VPRPLLRGGDAVLELDWRTRVPAQSIIPETRALTDTAQVFGIGNPCPNGHGS